MLIFIRVCLLLLMITLVISVVLCIFNITSLYIKIICFISICISLYVFIYSYGKKIDRIIEKEIKEFDDDYSDGGKL